MTSSYVMKFSTFLLTGLAVLLGILCIFYPTKASYLDQFAPSLDYYSGFDNYYQQYPAVFQPAGYFGDSRNQYVLNGSRYSGQFYPDKASIIINGENIEINFINANQSGRFQGLDRIPRNLSTWDLYYGTSPLSSARPAYQKLIYEDLYPNIDAAYFGNQDQFGYDFWFDPGSTTNMPLFSLNDVKDMEIDENGDLVVLFDGRTLRSTRPTAYQNYGGINRQVSANYQIYPNQQIGFDFGRYNPNQKLYMDPMYFEPIQYDPRDNNDNLLETFGPVDPDEFFSRPVEYPPSSEGHLFETFAPVDPDEFFAEPPLTPESTRGHLFETFGPVDPDEFFN